MFLVLSISIIFVQFMISIGNLIRGTGPNDASQALVAERLKCFFFLPKLLLRTAFQLYSLQILIESKYSRSFKLKVSSTSSENRLNLIFKERFALILEVINLKF
jgi:hypothetical protein